MNNIKEAILRLISLIRAIKTREIYLLIFVVALAVRLLYLHQISFSPFFDSPHVNEFEYEHWARDIFEGKASGRGIEYHGSLYPYFLSLLYKIFGRNFYIGRFFGVLISCLSCVLIADITRKVFGRNPGFLAGVIAAVYWPLIYWSCELLVATFVLFLNLIVFRLLLKGKETLKPFIFFLSGLCIGLSAATRPNILLLMPLFLYWIIKKIPRAARGQILLVMLLGIVIVIAPITVRNYKLGGEFVLVQGQTGLNVYLGLNPDLDGLHSIRPGAVFDKLMLLPVHLELYTNRERGNFWINDVLLRISDNPVGFFTNMLRRIFLILSRYEISSGRYIFYNRNLSPFIYSLPGFWLVGPLGICGAVMGLKQGQNRELLYIFLLGIFMFSIPFQTCSRYRLAFVPFLIIFTAFLPWEFRRLCLSKDLHKIKVSVIALIIAAVIVNVDIARARISDHSRVHLMLAQTYRSKSDDEGALSEIKKSLFLHPKSPDVWKTLGDIYLMRSNLFEAEKAYKKAVLFEPEHFRAIYNLGIVKLRQGKKTLAKNYFKRALIIYPFYEKARRSIEYCE